MSEAAPPGFGAPPGSLDSDGMFAASAGLPEQLTLATERAKGAMEPLPPGSVENVVVLGMGGSGVAGAVLEAVASGLMPVPLVLCGGYSPPAFVGPGTLCFAVSFSGNTEETLAAARAAAGKGATLVAVTTGGELARLAKDAGAFVYDVPAEIGWPRSGIGATSAPLLVACEEAGILPGASAQIEQAVAQLARRRDELTVAGGGLGSEVARRIGRTIPLAYGAPPAGAVAARRLKTQVNENAKMPAFFASQPELCHNEICGWGLQGDVTRQLVTVVNLRSKDDHPQVAARFELVDEIIREAVADIVTIWAEGSGVLAQLFDLVLIVDFISLQLAAREGVDPGPVPVLMELKEKLSER